MAVKNNQLLQMIKGLEFPDYEFKPYPKAVAGPQKDAKGNPITVLVNSREEEEQVLGHPLPSPHVAKPYVSVEDMTDEELAAAIEARKAKLPGAKPNTVTVEATPKTALQGAKDQAEALAESPGGVLKK